MLHAEHRQSGYKEKPRHPLVSVQQSRLSFFLHTFLSAKKCAQVPGVKWVSLPGIDTIHAYGKDATISGHPQAGKGFPALRAPGGCETHTAKANGLPFRAY